MIVNKKYKSIRKCYIYELICRKTGMRYIGHTIRGLTARLNKHRNTRNCSSRIIIENGDYYIKPLEIIYIKYGLSAVLKEQWYMNHLENINDRSAIRLKRIHKPAINLCGSPNIKINEARFRERHRERLRIQANQHYYKHHDKIRERTNTNRRNQPIIYCPCGGKYKQRSLYEHQRTKRHKKYIDNSIQ
jgi:hypothetical protein